MKIQTSPNEHLVARILFTAITGRGTIDFIKTAALAILFSATFLDNAAAQSSTVRYELRYDPAIHGRVQVEITAPGDGLATVLVMPRAIPMGYSDVHYDRFVGKLEAFARDGSKLTVTRDGEAPRWKLGEEVMPAQRVRYEVDVDALEQEVLGASDASKARSGYLGLLGYSVFAMIEGLEQRPIQLSVHAPEEWPVFLTLAPRAPPSTGSAQSAAANFYALADSQVAMGPDLEVHLFDAAVPLFVAQYAEQESSAEVLGAQAAAALNALAEYFGEVPFSHYTVQVEYLQPRSGDHSYGFSMEHLNSCTIYFDTSRVITDGTEPRGSTRDLYNLAHHIAHSWVPKRAAAKGYFPWSWELSPVLDSIWFSEGWGQYVAAAALAEEGALGDSFRQRLVRTRFRSTLEDAPDFLKRLDLIEVSRIASTRYSQDFRTGRNVFSRGGLMAFEIDEAIRAGSGGKKSLRDVMRRLMAEGKDKPLDLDRIPSLSLEETKVDIGEIYRRWLGPVP